MVKSPMQHQMSGSRPDSSWLRAARRVKFKLLGALFMTLALSPAATAQTLTPSKLAFHGKLDNGLEIVVVPDRRAPVVTNMVWYKVGAADEVPGKSGIAHFVEHLMFKGTRAHPAGEFQAKVDQLGGSENAFTTADYTVFHETIAKQHLHLMMEYEADRMANLVLSNETLLPERQVILEELHLRDDDKDLLSDLRLRTIIAKYSDHISVPILMPAEPDAGEADQHADDASADAAYTIVNRASALWTRPQSEISSSQTASSLSVSHRLAAICSAEGISSATVCGMFFARSIT